MSSTPYFKFYFSDLAGDTLHLSTEQMGAYVLLLGAMWNAGGSLPNDAQKLQRITRVSPRKWAKLWADIVPFFETDGDTISHHRLTKEHQKVSAEVALGGPLSATEKKSKSRKSQGAGAENAPRHAGAIHSHSQNPPKSPEGGPEDIPIGWEDHPEVVEAFTDGGVLHWLKHFTWQDVPRRCVVTTNPVAHAMVQRSSAMQSLWRLGLDIERQAAAA